MDLTQLHAAGIAASAARLDLDAARRDLWPRATLAMRDGSRPAAPDLITWPRSSGEVQQVLDWAKAHDRLVVPYGAGSGVCGAAAGREGSVVIDTKRMRGVEPVDLETRTVRCQAGLLGQHLEDHLARQGWTTGHSPSSIMCSTVGGYVAARSAGQFSSRYGVFDDMTLAVEAVAPSGIVRAGTWCPPTETDLLPLIAGSEGSLAVVTEVLVRVSPLPDTRWLRGFAFPDLASAWSAMRALMQAELWPSVLRLYDPLDTRIGGPARKAQKEEQGPSSPGVWHRLRDALDKVPALRHHLLDLPLSLPGLVNRIASGLGDEVLMIVGFEGTEAVVNGAVGEARRILEGARDLGSAPGDYWFAHRHDVSYKLAPVFVGGGWADTMEVAAPWSRLGELHDRVRAALGRHCLVMAHFSHAYIEGCSIYFSFAGAGRMEVYDAAWTEALEAARDAGGTVTHHHGVGQLKARAAAREAGAAVQLWRQAKARLDPDHRMNPGRLFPTDVPVPTGPPPPSGGPVFSVDRESLMAEVDPNLTPQELAAALAAHGLAPRLPPDRPLLDWLKALRRGDLEGWEHPYFAVQGRLADGSSVRLGPAPRSAAGPDLRPALIAEAAIELVQIPVRPLVDGASCLRSPNRALELERAGVRPAFAEEGSWTLAPAATRAWESLASGPGVPAEPAPRVPSGMAKTASLEEEGAP